MPSKRVAYFLLVPTLVILISVTIYPLFYSITVAFRRFNLTKPHLPRNFVGFQNFAYFLLALGQKGFFVAVKNTFILTGGLVALEFMLGFGIALLIKAQNWERTLYTSAIILPMAMVPVIAALMWRFMYHPIYGLVNFLLHFIGLSGVSWLAHPTSAMISIMIVDIWQWTPFVVLMVLAGLISLPEAVFEAARIDGASRWQSLVHITFPMLRHVILVTLLLRSMDTFKLFDKVYAITEGGPGSATETLSMHTYRIAFKFFRMGRASALSYLMLIFIVVLSIVLIRTISQRQSEG